MTKDVVPFRRLLNSWTICATLIVLLACGIGSGSGASSDQGQVTEQVKGLVVEVVGRNIVEIEFLRIRTEDDQVWTFTAEGPLAFSPSHLREHQLFGQAVVVSYVRRGDVLVAVEVGD